MNKIAFSDFLQIIKPEETPLLISINDTFMNNNCCQEIKESASGYTVSYLYNKKTIANFVCRKNGVKIRITPQKPFFCDDILHDLPDNMKNNILRAGVCKRLVDPNLCNSRCPMGYTFNIDGECYKKCRSLAFLFSVTEENLPYINKFINKSLSINKD